jgi:tellurite resistance protein TerC
VDLLHHPWFFWVAFNGFVVLMLVLDLFVFHRTAHVVRFKEALGWSLFWVSLAVAFGVLVYFWRGPAKTLEFATGYLVEESLSVDNLFVFLTIFTYFKVEGRYQHRVLFWGIIGALVMRGVFIVAGVALIRRFEWIIYVFGAFLVVTGLKMLRAEEKEIEPEKNLVIRLVRRWLPITHDYPGGSFFVRRDGRNYATTLLIVLLVVETSDLLFAMDSIPAVLAISRDPFIVYTSNVFAILGLRALYFALAGMMEVFHHLHYGLSAILVFIGVKMVLSSHYPIPIHVALSVVAIILLLAILSSRVFPDKKKAAATRS